MKHELKKRLREDTDYYHLDPLVKYTSYLEEEGRLLKIDNVYFDAQAMLDPFVCDTRLCIPGKNGRTITGLKTHRTCCGGYAPRVSPNEKKRIESILPEIEKRFPALEQLIKKEGGFYEWDEDYDRLLVRPKEDWCIFMSNDPESLGFHFCMLHVFCNENGLNPLDYKPSACLMFPLVLMDVDEKENIMLISKHSYEVATVGEGGDSDEDDYLNLACCSPNRLATKPLYVEMRDTLEYMFGETVWRRLDKALAEWENF